MGGFLPHIGFYPTEGYLMPKGVQNMIPETLRPYVPTYKYTFTPFLLSFYDLADHALYPLGMKTFPDHVFASKRRKMYRAVLNSDMEEIEKLVDEGFDLREVVIPEYGLTAMGKESLLP